MSKTKANPKTEAKSDKKIKVKQTGSIIGRTKDQEATLIGLGLRGIGSQKILIDTACVRGMINKVRHLITFEEI